jgi:hypothetical protein
VPEFYFSFFDIDNGKKGAGKETLILPNVDDYFISDDAEFTKNYDAGTKTLTLDSTHEGHGCDNPKNPMDLGSITCEKQTVVRSRRAVTLEYLKRTRFTAEFTAGEKGGGRNIVFAGRSSLTETCSHTTTTPPPTTTSMIKPTEECEPVTKKIDELEEVITSMEGCPGLESDVYGPPEWVGDWARVVPNPDPSMSTEQIDALLLQACANKFGASSARRVRAAEVSEILAGTIKNLPAIYDGGLPILPTCPLCVSKDDSNARICWKDGQPLTSEGESGNCKKGPRNALCVYVR